MSTTLHLRPVLNVVIFTALVKSATLWAGEPVRLTDAQMDAATAGSYLAVGVGAVAAADSPNAYTSTSTSTFIKSTPPGNVLIGKGSGNALACCGSSSYTDVQTAYAAQGDKVIAHSNGHDISTPTFSSSTERITVIAIDIPPH
ncbi:hypothetical protein [Nitrosomonas sp. Nm34]|uniref:hypothetical protein n=1 Tax=Nitrosomonas sp. Nm34 TaxID=1881055 RepID=UPI0008F0436D|nr:hypothetical protein [Nitrosomonas sp. Nm34]SFI47404.1 hypothetical protein SAMN05428978_101215 [Nitrosomonas sp. Nm34]